MRDGSIQFLFEAEDGIAVSADAKAYTIVLRATVRNVSSEGEVDYENPVHREWTVEIAPQPFATVMGSTAEPVKEKGEYSGTVASPSAIAPQQVIVPDAYHQSGTLPVYQASPRNFQGMIDFSWFNQSGIAKEEVFTRHIGGTVDYADGGHLDWHEHALYYQVYDGTYEAVSEVFDGRNVKTVTETLPKGAMAVQAGTIAGWMLYGFPGTEQVYSLERTELTDITLDEAKARAEELLINLGLDGYTCTAALDMDLDRIREMGNELNHQMDIGGLSGNAFRYDYGKATAADEGYYLKYHKFGSDGDLAGQFYASFYVTKAGIQSVSLTDIYVQGAQINTPERLVDVNAVSEKLPEEMAHSRHPETLTEIRRAILTWMPMRAEGGQDMVLSPVWMLTYVSSDGASEGYTGWAVFDAVNGMLVDAIFN